MVVSKNCPEEIMTKQVLTCVAMLVFSIIGGRPWLVSAEKPAKTWLATREPLTILSANDGDSHFTVNKDDRKLNTTTADSITVIHLGPDHPPIVKTVYDTVPNSIGGAPYMAMTGDGHYGFVTSNANGRSGGEPDSLMSVIDLTSPDLTVVQKVEVPGPRMVLAHPDGRHIIVPCATGFQVFEMRAATLVLVKDNKTDVVPDSIAISPQGDRIVARARRGGTLAPDSTAISPQGGRIVAKAHRSGTLGVHVFSYREGVISHVSEVKVRSGLLDFDNPFSGRFSPDGKRVLMPNGGGQGSTGKLGGILSIDMTLDPPIATEVIPQVCDGIESVAFHPKGKFAVVSCLEEDLNRSLVVFSHLAVIDLTSKPARVLYYVNVEPIPEGIEFSPDGSQLFVGLTFAHHIAVFDVEGFMLKRSPFVIRVGNGPSSMALGRRFRPSHRSAH